jgi:pentatricopeptide repeat protein
MARNPKKPEGASKCKLDDPTRWLDCILLNMHRRGVQLDIHLANAMLATFSSTGRTGRALHFFYQLKSIPIHSSSSSTNSSSSNNQKRVKMVRKGPPPSYQLPSQSMNFATLHTNTTTAITATMNNSPSTKLSKEMDPKWSLPLTAAFAFAKSISQGACGHEPIQLDISSYNILLKACCYRGALCRAIYLVRKEIPNLGLEPNTVTYNTLMHGLARIADTTSLREFLTEMVNKNIHLSEYTVQAIVLGYLNSGDPGGAITLVQDIFNQHNVLPPYTSHLDILEHCLVNDLLFEAKRHVYFIQQVWKFVPPHHMTRDKLIKIKFVQKSPKLGKEALKKLFEYHGETLTDADFF